MNMDNGVVIIVVAAAIAALAVLMWSRRVRRTRHETPEERYRRDLAALRPQSRALTSSVDNHELWSAGAPHNQSRAKKAGATLMAGLIGSGCGGCGGCGCGG